MRQRSSKAQGARPLASALDSGLRLLARRAHSRSELRLKLRRRKYPPEEVESTLARLEQLGYLDDPSFARALVRRRSPVRGPLALSAELAARGVDRAQAEAAVSEFDVPAQIAAARRLVERLLAPSGAKTPSERPPLGYRESLNIVGPKLLRRGFSTGVVMAACRAVLAEAAEPSDD